MEIPDALADSCKSYINDVQRLIPVGQIVVALVAVLFVLTAKQSGNSTDGIWLMLMGKEVSFFIDEDNWKNLLGSDLLRVLLCIALGTILFSFFQKVVFWAITSGSGFSDFIASQKTVLSVENSDNKDRIEWLRMRFEKEMLPIRRTNLLAEVICGVAVSTLVIGSWSSLVDWTATVCLSLVSYVYIQASAKRYIKNAFPLALVMSNVCGFIEKAPISST